MAGDVISGGTLLSARFDKALVPYATASAPINPPCSNVTAMSRLSIRKYSSINCGCEALDWAIHDLQLGADYLWSIFSCQT